TRVARGGLAVASALLGRTFGLRDERFHASELALLVSMFVISRYVLPLVHRRDRGASAEEHVGGLLEQLAGWRVIHDASMGRGNVDHILIGPAGVFTVETKSRPDPVRVSAVHGATLRQAHAQRKLGEAIVGLRVEALLVFRRAWVGLAVAIATLGIAATLLAYAVSPGVRHAVGHAAHSVRHAVSRMLDRDGGQHARANRPAARANRPPAHANRPPAHANRPPAHANRP